MFRTFKCVSIAAALIATSCAHDRLRGSSSESEAVEAVVSAFNAEDWGVLCELVNSETQTATRAIRGWEMRSSSGHGVRTGELVHALPREEGPDGKPCVEYSFRLENTDGGLNPHWLQVFVRQEEGRWVVVDFWEFGS